LVVYHVWTLKKITTMIIVFSVLLLVPVGVQNSFAVIFGGIDFPDGVSSFADAVITYDNTFSGGPAPTDADFLDPTKSLGPPDFASPIGSVSLGRGGLLEVEFVDNVLTNSGDAALDLHIFEVGPDVEDTFIAIRPTAATDLLLGLAFDANGDGFYEIGKVFGSTDSIDIDSIFPAAAAGTYMFDAVQLIDDFAEGQSIGPTVGADIDSVGAITSMAPPPLGPVGGELIPLDTTMVLAAGTQYTAAWMIPTIVSAIGIGLVITRKL